MNNTIRKSAFLIFPLLLMLCGCNRSVAPSGSGTAIRPETNETDSDRELGMEDIGGTWRLAKYGLNPEIEPTKGMPTEALVEESEKFTLYIDVERQQLTRIGSDGETLYHYTVHDDFLVLEQQEASHGGFRVFKVEKDRLEILKMPSETGGDVVRWIFERIR